MTKQSFKAVIVKPDCFPETVEFPSFKAVLRVIGIKNNTPWQTNLVENIDVEGVGLCVRDQDECKGRKNIMGINGAFAIVGMERTLDENGNTKMTAFTSLTEEQAKGIQKAIIRQAVFSGYAYGVR